MIKSTWYNDTINKNTEILVDATINDNGFVIEKHKEDYSFSRVSMDFLDITPNSFYSISVNVKADGMNARLLFTYYNEKNKELEKGYIGFKDRLLINKNAKSLRITFLFFGYGKGRAEVSDIELSFESEYKERLVTLASVSNPRFFTGEHAEITCDDNLNGCIEYIDRAAKEAKIDIAVLTENFYTIFVNTLTTQEGFVFEDSKPVLALRAKAKEHNMYIAFSIKEKDNKGQRFNTCFLIDREGNVAGKYHKSHLTISELEAGMIPGNEAPVFETDFGKIGIAICWDLYFPEYVKALTLKGAEIILNPSAGFNDERSKTRASENGVFLVCSNHRPRNARIYDRYGAMIADGIDTGVAIATVDLNQKYPVKWLSVNSEAEYNNIYKNERRPDLYNCLSEKGGLYYE